MARRKKVAAAALDLGDPFAPEVAPPLASDVPVELLAIVGGMRGWQPAAEVLVNVRAVPTCLLGLDRALGVGGFPLGRMYVVHGPSGQGKSSVVLALVRSFLERGHLACLVDAEHTSTTTWTDDMLAGVARHPLFVAKRPRTYEETIDAVDEVLGHLPTMREAKPDLATLVVVDSINKLTPERELETLRRQGADAIDKGWGRLRAATNQAWIDHLTPLLGALDVAIVFIAQERTKRDATPDDVRYGSDWEIKGGRGILYDSSLVLRVTRAAWIKAGEADKSPVVGTRHRVRVHKSKVEWLAKQEDFFFHVVNGQDGRPAGFDLARDLLEVGLATGVLEQKGAWISWHGGRWNGADRFLAKAGVDTMLGVEREVRAALERRTT